MTGWYIAGLSKRRKRSSAALQARLEQCGLEMHPDKTKIVYCKDGSRKGKYPNTKFDFLGYTFRPRMAKNHKRNSHVCELHTGGQRGGGQNAMRQTTGKLNYRNRTELSLADISRIVQPGPSRGWLEYYGRYSPSAMYPVLRHFNHHVGGLGDEEVSTAKRP